MIINRPKITLSKLCLKTWLQSLLEDCSRLREFYEQIEKMLKVQKFMNNIFFVGCFVIKKKENIHCLPRLERKKY